MHTQTLRLPGRDRPRDGRRRTATTRMEHPDRSPQGVSLPPRPLLGGLHADPHQHDEGLGNRGALEHRSGTDAVRTRIVLEIEATHLQHAKEPAKLLLGGSPPADSGPRRVDDGEERLEGCPPLLGHATRAHGRRLRLAPEALAHSAEHVERPAALVAGGDDQAVTRLVHRTHGDAVHVEAIDHRVDELVHRAPEIRCPGVESAHAALRLHEDEAPAGQGDADVIDGEPRLAPDGVDADRRTQPESRRGVTDSVRRPPREHLGLKREAARGAGSSCRRVRRLTGCRVRHMVDRVSILCRTCGPPRWRRADTALPA